MAPLDAWIRRRLRSVMWTQWKRFARRVKELCKRGVGRDWAVRIASSGLGPWRLSHEPSTCQARPRPSLMPSACLVSPPVLSLTRRTAVYGPVRTVVWEGRSRDAPPYPDWKSSCLRVQLALCRFCQERSPKGPSTLLILHIILSVSFVKIKNAFEMNRIQRVA